MNYSYEFFCFWAENLMLAQISVIDCNSAPKIMSCSEKLEFIGQSDAFCGSLAGLIFDIKFCLI